MELAPRTAEQGALDLWREEFNQERPHEALGMKCPGEVYQNSQRPYEGTPEDLEYPGMDARRVLSTGKISWGGSRYFITTSLAGWSVGLKHLAGGGWKCGSAGCCWDGLSPRRRASSGRRTARWKLVKAKSNV